MYGRAVYFPDRRFFLNPGTRVIDLGANSGLFTLLAALRGCSVVAVEAQAGFVQEIEELMRRHGVEDRVSVEQALVGAGRGLLSEAGVLERASHFRGRQPARLTMTEIFARHHIDAVDFLKCDIEGSEFELFDDCDEWLPKVRRIAMEVHSDFGSATDLTRFFERQGYDVMLVDNLSRRVRSLDDSGYLFATR